MPRRRGPLDEQIEHTRQQREHARDRLCEALAAIDALSLELDELLDRKATGDGLRHIDH